MSTLLESILTSEFTFGFELEAYVSDETLKKYAVTGDEEEGEESEEEYWNRDDEYDIGKLYRDLQYLFSQYFGSGINVVYDGSLGEGGFEFPTPPMSLTPKNIKRCVNFLEDCLYKYNIYTDESCGFHVHFAFPTMNEQDMAWIICQIAMNDKWVYELEHFTGDDFSFEFLSNWANTEYLTEIKKCIDVDGLPNFKQLSTLLTSDKYRLIRLHPQGTLEWRGPRNFMNERNINDIEKFFIKVLNVSQIFSKCMDEKYLGKYISRSIFNKAIDFSGIEKKSKDMKSTSTIIDKIARQAIENPLVLTKIKNYNGFRYDELISTIEALYSTSMEKSINDLYIELRYKPFRSSMMLYALVMNNKDFINYVDHGLPLLIKNIFDVVNPYEDFCNVKFRPEVLEEFIKIGHSIRPMYNLKSYISTIKKNRDCQLASPNSLNVLRKVYGSEKVDKQLAKIGLK